MAPIYGWGSSASRLEQLRGHSQIHSWNIHLSISKLTGKTEFAKHLVRNITCSRAAGQDNNMTGQTASEQVLFYLNVHLFATIVSIKRIWEVGSRVGIHPPDTHTHTHTHTSTHQYINFQKWNEMEFCTRNIPCAMMTINNAIDYVTLLLCQGDILSKVSRSYQVSNMKN